MVSALVQELNVPISIDSKKAATMRAMLELGADIINDVHALEDRGALEVVRASNCGICLMHMRGMPENMQDNTIYDDVLTEVQDYLAKRVEVCLAAGVAKARLLLDPGFGFGKNATQNLQLVKHIRRFGLNEYPLLLGVSRKSTIGQILGGAAVEKRLIGSVMLAALGVQAGASIVRVHDVAETRDALQMLQALQEVV